jgi:glycosyltransferase involved in cell wall biosynthesis
MSSNISVAIIVSRADRGLSCIRAILASTVLPSQLVVVFVGTAENFQTIETYILQHFNGNYVSVLKKHGSPAQLRNVLINEVVGDDLLILDDDIYIDNDLISNFLKCKSMLAIKTTHILGCGVRENGFHREVGARFAKIWRGEEAKIRLEQISLSRFQTLSHDVEKIDLITQPPFYITHFKYRTTSLKFDEKYPWAYEIFDWFMQLKSLDIPVLVCSFVGASHDPGGYVISENSAKKNKNHEGFLYFRDKWSVTPEKYFKHSFLRGIFREVTSYYAKKSRVWIKKYVDRR